MNEITTQPLQTPLAKIVSRFLIDFSVFLLLAWALNFIVFNTNMSSTYKSHHHQMVEIQDTYKLQSDYGFKYYLSGGETVEESYIIYNDANGDYIVKNTVDSTAVMKQNYQSLLRNDTNYASLLSKYQTLSILLLSFVVGGSQLVTFFLIPLFTKHRKTVGSHIFKLQTVKASDNTPVTWYQLLAGFLILAIFISILPYIVIGEMTLLFVPLILIAFMLFNKDGRTIHELIVNTKVISDHTLQMEQSDE